MSGYHPRHAANEPPPPPSGPLPPLPPPPAPGPGRRRRPTKGSLGLAAGVVALLAVVAVLVVASLPHSNHPAASHGPLTTHHTSTARPTVAPSSAATSPPATGPATGPAKTERTVVRSAPQRTVAQSTKTTTRKATTTGPVPSTSTRTSASTNTAVTKAPTTVATTARPTAPPTTSPSAAGSPAVNLAVPAGFGPLIRQVWVEANPGGAGLSAADVQSTLPGSVYYAEQPAIGDYWAISRFVPTSQAGTLATAPAGKDVLAQFSDVSVFNRAPGGNWAYLGSFSPGSCPTTVPAPVYSAWGLCQVGS